MRTKSYIIRVYRCVQKESGEYAIDGIVEVPISGQRTVFHSLHDLRSILSVSAKSLGKEQNQAPKQ
jgi:hypothetical protein